jgi:GTP cyclohydrolase II
MIPLPPDPAHDAMTTRATVRVDRARLELRHGRSIAIRATDKETWQLTAAVETLGEQRLQRFVSLGLPLRLLLTAERLHALCTSAVAQPMALPMSRPLTLARLQSLAAVTLHHDASTSLDGALPAEAAQLAALALAKRARLTPALLGAELPSGAAWARWLDDTHVLRLEAQDLAIATPPGSALRRVSDARVPIEAAEDCQVVLYREVEGDAEHQAIIVGQPALDRPVPVRLHSACLTGDLLGSLRCDCGEQLRGAAERLARDGGVLLYLAQEGRADAAAASGRGGNGVGAIRAAGESALSSPGCIRRAARDSLQARKRPTNASAPPAA